MIVSPRRAVGWSAAALVIALAGCSSSGAPSSSSPAPAGTGSNAIPSAPSTGGAPADAATTQAVTAAFETFFGSDATTAESEAALQHGPVFEQALEDQAKSSYADKSSAKVTAVTVAGDLAFVTFSVSSNGAVLLPDFKGNAVRESGKWKVAAATFCSLLKLAGNPPAECSDPAITALPH